MTGKYNEKGFTFVELLITGFIFSIIFGVATATFVGAVRIQKYNVSHQQILDQSSYAIEYIARALRMAKNGGSAACTNGANYKISNGGKRIDFLNYNDKCQHFLWDTNLNQIEVGGGDFSSDTTLTSSRYTVNDLSFTVNGDSAGDNLQPRVTIFFELKDNRLIQDAPVMDIQTTVSQRNFDE
jgi:Tfp pilus assembly protein FimT